MGKVYNRFYQSTVDSCGSFKLFWKPGNPDEYLKTVSMEPWSRTPKEETYVFEPDEDGCFLWGRDDNRPRHRMPTVAYVNRCSGFRVEKLLNDKPLTHDDNMAPRNRGRKTVVRDGSRLRVTFRERDPQPFDTIEAWIAFLEKANTFEGEINTVIAEFLNPIFSQKIVVFRKQ